MEADDIVSNIRTLEGELVCITAQFTQHCIGNKAYFPMGSLAILENAKKMNIYESQIISISCLNHNMEWDQRYFTSLRNSLLEPNSSYVYSYRRDDEDSYLTKLFTISFSETYKTDIKREKDQKISILINSPSVLFQIKLSYVSTTNALDKFFSLTIAISQKNLESKRNLVISIEKEKKEKHSLINELEKVARNLKTHEEGLFEKFTLLIYEKKLKIKELKRELEARNAGGFARNLALKAESTQPNSIDLSQPTQTYFRGPLFDLSQDYRPSLTESQISFEKPKPRIPISQANSFNTEDADESKKSKKSVFQRSDSISDLY